MAFLLGQDLIIEGIYADIIHGKLDQRNQQLEVDYVIGRDIRPTAITQMVTVLREWSVLFLEGSMCQSLCVYVNTSECVCVGWGDVFTGKRHRNWSV